MLKMINEFIEKAGYRYFIVIKDAENIKNICQYIIKYRDEFSLYRLTKEINLLNFAEEIDIRQFKKEYYLGIKFADEDSFNKYCSGCLNEINEIEYFVNRLKFEGKIKRRNRKLNKLFKERCV